MRTTAPPKFARVYSLSQLSDHGYSRLANFNSSVVQRPAAVPYGVRHTRYDRLCQQLLGFL